VDAIYKLKMPNSGNSNGHELQGVYNLCIVPANDLCKHDCFGCSAPAWSGMDLSSQGAGPNGPNVRLFHLGCCQCHVVAGFVIGFLDFAVPFALWQWISSAIRNSRARRNSRPNQTSAGEIVTTNAGEIVTESSGKERKMGEKIAGGLGCLFQGALALAVFAGWCQHVYTCFNEHYWGFLIAGAIFFPIAIIHGWGIWFGWWH